MSDKPKFPRAEAQRVAEQLMAMLAPSCERIIIAGSLRRRKLMVGDIELLFIPRMHQERDGLFDTKEVSCAEWAIQALLDGGIIVKRPSKVGVFTWGPLNKLAIHKASGIPVDFFASTLAKWHVAKVIRTGGKATNLLLTTGAQKLGRKLHAYGEGFTDADGTEIACHSEREVFALAGVNYSEPWERE